jgi:hypothetical protein
MFYSEDAYVHKMSQASNVGINIQSVQNNFTLYPNPVKDQLTIELGKEYSYIEANVLDITGKILSTHSFDNSNLINIRMDVSSGIYIIQLKDKSGVITHLKVVKE